MLFEYMRANTRNRKNMKKCVFVFSMLVILSVPLVRIAPITRADSASILLSVVMGPVGSVVEVDGSGFTGGGTINRITVDGVKCGILDAPIYIDPLGDFFCEFVIPQVAEVKPCEVTAIDSYGVGATDIFEVTGLAGIEVDPTYGPQGSVISIQGENFTHIIGEDVFIELWDEGLTSKIRDLEIFQTDFYGEFSGDFTVPTISSGDYAIVAQQTNEYNINASTPFRVGLIIIILVPDEGLPGTEVILTGIGFTPSGNWSAWFDGIPVFENETATEWGEISGTFNVPSIELGIYNVTALDQKFGITVEAKFRVEYLTLNMYSGPVGSLVHTRGRGFTPNEVISEITVDGVRCGILDEPIHIDPLGEFACEFVIPQLPEAKTCEVSVLDSGGFNTTVLFNVTGLAAIFTEKKYGDIGEVMEITGHNFTAIFGEEVRLELWQEDQFVTDLNSYYTTSQGSFGGFFTVPARSPGLYDLVAIQEEFNISDSKLFKIGPVIIIVLPDEGPPGSEVTLTGVGFTEGGLWNATFGDIMIFENEPVESGGIILETFSVPMVRPGNYTITAIDLETEIAVSTNFEVRFPYQFRVAPYINVLSFNLNPGNILSGYMSGGPEDWNPIIGRIDKGKIVFGIDVYPDNRLGHFETVFLVADITTLRGEAIQTIDGSSYYGPLTIELIPISFASSSQHGMDMTRIMGLNANPAAWYTLQVNPIMEIIHLNTNPGMWLNGYEETYEPDSPILGYVANGKMYCAIDYLEESGNYELGLLTVTVSTLEGDMITTDEGIEIYGPGPIWLTPLK